MPCYHPLHGWRSSRVTKNGKRPIVFNKNHGYQEFPVSVPCGACIGCRIDRSRMWALRCTHEAKMHEKNCFLTLTYDDEHLPENNTLVKSDLQKFFKRLRKQHGSFRYYAAGEYGDNTQRPHYHVIVFGLDFSEDRKKHSTNVQGNILYTSPSLAKIWKFGHSSIGAFSYTTAAYTARYVMKKVSGKRADNHYSRINLTTGECYELVPEFSLVSLRPAIGATWYNKFKSDTFPSDFLVHEGKKHSVPRFYYNRLQIESEQMFKQVRIKRIIEREKSAHDNTAVRLHVRETVKKSQLGTLKRSYL